MSELILETVAPLFIMVGVALGMIYLSLIEGLERLNNGIDDQNDKWETTK